MIRSSKKQKILWIVDFDYALFDLYRFMDEFEKMLERRFGVPELICCAAKIKVQRRALYNFERHLHAIEKELGLPRQKVAGEAMRHVKTLLTNAEQYFFHDAMPFMRRIAKDGEVILLSYGHAPHQRRKVKASGLERYCDRTIFTATKRGKAKWVKKLATAGRRVIKSSRADFAASRVFLVERPTGKYFPIPPHKDYVVVRDLRKVEAFL
jgi:FMN phosphatase YigB (HAD superfamily)